jgi:hypothetical protein
VTCNPLDRKLSHLKTKRLVMLLKKIDVLRCTFILVFVVPPVLISSPANARLAVADGEYVEWEGSITVKSGKVVFCSGLTFDGDYGAGSSKYCDGWKFTTSSRNVVKAISRSNQSGIFYFCRPPQPSKSTKAGIGYYCGPNGWRPRTIISSL